MLDQFTDGLQIMGLLKSFPDIFLPLFVYTGNVSAVEVAEAIFVDRDSFASVHWTRVHWTRRLVCYIFTVSGLYNMQ